jgi:LysR family transcriptional regulator for bpeEF and oprC
VDQLQAIRVFARVFEAGGFRKAADSLGIPKATVSKHIQDLELHLGVKLLQRTTRSVKVTTDGVAYYERTIQLVRELDDIDSSFGSANAKPMGRIRIDVAAAIATSVVIPALPTFHALYPGIEIELGVSDRSVDLFRENIDCVIRVGPVSQPSMVGRLIGAAPWVTCASPEYIARHGMPTHPSDFDHSHKLVNYVSASTGRVFPSVFGRGDKVYEAPGRAFINVNDSNAHIAAALAGLGIIHTFLYTVKCHIADGRLVPVLRGWEPEPYPLNVAYAPNRHMSQRVRAFIDWVVSLFDQLE